MYIYKSALNPNWDIFFMGIAVLLQFNAKYKIYVAN
jgi:hypothetical protein